MEDRKSPRLAGITVPKADAVSQSEIEARAAARRFGISLGPVSATSPVDRAQGVVWRGIAVRRR